MVELGLAIDITHETDRNAIAGDYTLIGISKGVYGVNGKLFKSSVSGQLYAITARTTAIYIF